MSKTIVQIRICKGTFIGLAKQNMYFHQAIGELIDNAIAATPKGETTDINVVLRESTDQSEEVDVFVIDKSSGMTQEELAKALQLGETPDSDNRLNEHGFGLKNSIATLTGGVGYWKIWTRKKGKDKISSVDGPFNPEMGIEDDDVFPKDAFIPVEASTIVYAKVKKTHIQTVQGRGAKAQDLLTLRSWLVEHLGVMYRGYLEPDPITNIPSAVIEVSKDTKKVRVVPVRVPIGSGETKYIDVSLKGNPYKLEYYFGTLDEVKRDELVGGKAAKYYYQGNQATQGIDIRLGKRTIATMQLGSIWKSKDGKTQLQRHNSLNDFVGELKIPELPRGVLTTVNNKTDFNLDDPDWQEIFNKLSDFPPIRNVREATEEELKQDWIEKLKAVAASDSVSDEVCVWPTGVRIDVYRKVHGSGDIIIYEIKVGKGEPKNLYQLKMYWDGLVINGEQPKEAFLLVEEHNSNLQEMANKMNSMSAPDFMTGAKSGPYNFIIKNHSDVQLSRKKTKPTPSTISV